ncbi:hypothetical protein S83_020987 [Arachis hypogaea]
MINRLSSGYAVTSNCVFWVNSEDEIEIGAAACVDYSTFSTLIGHDDYVDFVTYERSALRFGVHVMTINFRPGGAMAWGRHLFIGVTNLTETPCLKIGRELLGISHCVRDFEGVESSLDAVVSEAKFRSIGLADRVVTLIGSVRWPGVVCIKGCMGFSLEV